MVGSIGDLIVAIKADIDDFHKGMATARESMGVFQGTAKQVGATMRKVGATMTAAGAVAGAAIGLLVNEANRLNKAYREVSTLMDSGADAQRQFGDAAERISQTLGVQGGQLQVVQGLYQTLSASITDTSEAVNFMETAAKTAAVGLTDMETSVDVLSTVINAYGMETSEVNRVSNTLFATVREGKVRFEELARSIGPLISFAAQFGVSLEEVSAGMALMTRKGYSARRAAFALRSAIRSFMKPSDQMKELLIDIAGEELNVSDAAQKAIDTLEAERQELSNLKNQLSETKKEISDLKKRKEELNATIDQNRKKIEEIKSLTQEEANTVADLKGKIQELDAEKRGYNQSLSDNQAKIRDIKALTKEESAEVRKLTWDIKEATGALRGMSEEMDGLSDSMRENRIKMKEIRLEASKEGRELTEQEKKQMEELEVANEELSLQQLKLEDSMDKVQDKRRQAKGDIQEIESLTKDEWMQVQSLQDENDGLKKKIQEVNDKRDDAKNSIEGITSLSASERKEIAKLENQNELLKQKLGEVNGEMTNLEGTQSTLQDAIKKQKEEVGLAEDNMDSYATTMGQTLLEQEGYVGSLELMKKAADDANVPLEEVFRNQRALQAIYPTLTNNGKEFKGLLEEMQDPARTVSDIFDEEVRPSMGHKFRNTINKTRNTLADFGKAFGKSILPIINDVNTAITKLKDGFNNLDQPTKDAIGAFFTLGAAMAIIMGPIIFITGLLVSLVGIIGMSGLAWAVGIAAVGVAALGAAFMDMKNGGENVKSVLNTVTQALKDFYNFIKTVWNMLNKDLIPAIVNLAEAFAGVYSEMAKMAKQIIKSRDGFKKLKVAVQPILTALADGINLIANFIKENQTLIAKLGLLAIALVNLPIVLVIGSLILLKEAFDRVKTPMMELGNYINNKLNKFWDKWGQKIIKTKNFLIDFVNQGITFVERNIKNLKKAFDQLMNGNISGFFQTLKQNAIQNIKQLNQFIKKWNLKELLRQAINGAKEIVLGLVDDIVQGFIDLKKDIVLKIQQAITGVKNYLKNQAATDLYNAGYAAGKMLKDGVIELLDFVTEVGKKIGELVTWLKGPGKKKAKAGAKTAGDAMVTGFKNGIKLLVKAGKDTIDGIVQYIKSGQLLTDMKGAINTLFSNVMLTVKAAFTLGKVIKDTFKEVQRFIREDAPGMVKTAIDTFIDIITAPFEGFYDAIIGNSIIRDLFNDIKTYITSTATTMIKNAITTFFGNLLTTFQTKTKQIYTDFKNKTKTWFQWAKNKYNEVEAYVKKVFKRMWDNLKKLLRDWVNDFKTKLQSWYDKTKAKIREFVKWAKKTFRELWKDLKNKIKEFVKQFVKKAKELAKKVKAEFKDLKKKAKKRMTEMFSQIKQKLTTWAGEIVSKFQGIVEDVKGWFDWLYTELIGSSVIPEMLSAITSAVTSWSIADDFKGVMDDAKEKVENVTDAIVSGVESALGDVQEDASSMVSSAKSAWNEAKDTLNKHLPSPGGSGGGGGGDGSSGGGEGGDARLSTIDDNNTSTSSISRDRGSGMAPTGGALSPMAEGGFVTGPTAALVGEGTDDEYVTPLPDMNKIISRAVDIGSKMRNLGSNSSGAGDIIVSEGAIQINEGAFQGVAEEDMKDKVGDEVEGRLEDVLDEVRGRGK